MKSKSDSLTLFDKIFPSGKVKESLTVKVSLSFIFIISVAYFYLFGNSIFFYQENNLLFIFSDDYFQRFATKPGGLLVYAGNFLTQFYFNSLYGSLIVSTLLLFHFLVYRKISKHLSADKPFLLLFILLPSSWLLLLQTRYDFFVHHSLGFIVLALWFLVSIRTVKTSFRIVILVLFPLFYYLVGSFALIYLGMSIIYSLVYEKGNLRFYLTAFLIGTALLTFIIFKEIIFLQPVDHILGFPLLFNDNARLTIVSYLFSGFIIIFPLLIKSAGFVKPDKKFERVIPVATILAVFPLTIFLLFRSYDSGLTSLMQIEKHVYRQDWDAVIRHHEKSSSPNIIEQYYYSLALSEKNQLCDRLFYGRQDYGPMSLTLPRNGDQAYRAVYFYYDIGLVGEAHHLAYELMVQHGYRPENIKMLIKTELINGNYKIARRYINVLKKTMHYKKWAEKYERMLFNPDLVNSDPELGEKISMLPKSDFFITLNDKNNIDLLLNVNPDNKRAFEYKMARLLLEKDLLEVASEAKKMKGMGYTYIPRHIEEAILSLANITREYPDLDGLSIKDETKQRFVRYMTIFNTSKGNKSILEKVMKKPEKNTFWYYLHFSTMRSDFLRSTPVDNSIY